MSSQNTPFSLPPAGELGVLRRRLPTAGGQLKASCGCAPLGTITKTAANGMFAGSDAIKNIAVSHRADIVDHETGEIISFAQSESKGTHQDSRSARYSLHRAFRQVEPKHRTSACLHQVVDSAKTVQVIKDVEVNRARFNNLRVCGRVWTCPFCAAKISERRAAELSSAMAVAKGKGLKVALLTCTTPHVVQEGLKTLMVGLTKAWTGFTDNRVGKAIRADLGIVGTVRNIEVTHGENGWHPHFHCLVFYSKTVDLAEIESRWSAHWQHVSVKAGLRRPSDEHGLTLQNGDFAAKYVSKWGLEHELTKSMSKLGRKGGRTPFDILRDYEKGEHKEENAILFREFVAAFHGVRQLFWSAGLKKLLSVEDVSDGELALREDERPTLLVCELNRAQWKLVRNHHRAALLNLAEENPSSIPAFLTNLKDLN